MAHAIIYKSFSFKKKKKRINTWYLSYKNNSMILQNYTVEMNFKISQELFNIDVKHSSNLFHIK